MPDVRQTQVCVVGAGPAGMVAAHLLLQAGVDCVVVERSSQDDVYRRTRAGLIEWRTVRALDAAGLAGRLLREGTPHGTCEFRVDGERIVVDYAALYEGRTHWVYPQHELTRDLHESFLAAGGQVLYSTPATAARLGQEPTVECHTPEGGTLSLECQFVAGCDGFHGVARHSLPGGSYTTFEKHYDFGWLAVMADVAPSTEHIIYATHPHGFAGHMLRTPTVSRFYLEVPAADTVRQWPTDRIWSELHTRLAVDRWSLREGPISDVTIFPMHNFVLEPMQHGRLFLTGDAAHIITPAGAKGMNLAIQDAEELAAGLVDFFRTGREERLHGYSATRLPRIWRAMEFSYWMVSALHVSGEFGDPFARRLLRARLQHLRRHPFAASFAENYVGLL